MIVTWTITEGAVWDWTYSSFTGAGTDIGDMTVSGDTSYAETIRVVSKDMGTDPPTTTLTTDVTAADQTSTFYTSTVVTLETTIRTTSTVFDEENGWFQNRPSASYNEEASAIVVFDQPTTAVSTTQSLAFTELLSTISAGTYIKPLDLPAWLDVNVGDGAYAPTVAAWSSAVGFSQPVVNNTTYLPSVAVLQFSGRTTVFPFAETFQIPSATDDGDPTTVTQTWQSAAITWTEQVQTATTLTRAAAGSPITRSLQSYTALINSSRTSSSVFARLFTYKAATANFNKSWSSWWTSTTLTNHTYVVANLTTAGFTSTTRRVSSAATTFINLLGENKAGKQPLAVFEMSSSALRGNLQFGNYSHFYTQNAGLALEPAQEGRAALSDAGQAFPLPPQSFSTVFLQRGVTAPGPFQTRSRTSSNSTTSWSLGMSALTVATRSSNSTTQGGDSATYGLSAVGPTIWSASSQAIGGGAHTVAGGHYATNSLFVGGGLFTATSGSNEFTGTHVTVGTGATAFQPLPHFVPEIGYASVQTLATPVPTSEVGFFGVRTLGYPLTA